MRTNYDKECHDELVRIRQLLQAGSKVQEQQLQAQLETTRLLRKIAGVPTGEIPVQKAWGPDVPVAPRRVQPVDWGTQP